MAMQTENLARRYVRLDDVELAHELFESIGKVDSDGLRDHLYWLTSEALERWAPDVEQAETELSYRHDDNKDAELEAHNEAVKVRQLMRDAYKTANERAANVWQ